MNKELYHIKGAGFSLAEVVLSTALFSLIILSVLQLYFTSLSSTVLAGERTRALYLASEGLEVVKNIRDTGFQNLVAGTYGIGVTNNRWSLGGVSDTIGMYTRRVSIVSITGSSFRVTARVSWVTEHNQTLEVSLSNDLSSWNTRLWQSTSVADFNAGTHDDTVTSTVQNGEVQLESVLYNDWCSPDRTMYGFDLPGSGIANMIETETGKLFIGTGQNASGLAFVDLDVEYDPPEVSVFGTYNGGKTNALAKEGNYVFLGTDANGEEVVILDIGSLPYTQVGYFDSPGNGDGEAVAVQGDHGFMIDGDTLRVFDITSKTGSRTEVGNGLTLAGNGQNIAIVEEYAYIALDSATTQMQIVDITDPANLSIVAHASLTTGTGKGKNLTVNNSGDRVYLVTENTSGFNEFHIINTSSKSGNQSVIGGANTDDMEPTDISLVDDNHVVIVGINGATNYQVFDISAEGTPDLCGTLPMPEGIFAITHGQDEENNVYSYIVTGATEELQIIEGGPGGGGLNGVGYFDAGTYDSFVFDTGGLSYFYSVEWDETTPVNTDISLQIRTGNSANLTLQPWTGPNGTSGTFFTHASGQALPSVLQNKRYVQYRTFFMSDTVNSPRLNSITFEYE